MPPGFTGELRCIEEDASGAGTNTTLVLVATNARCSKVECHLLARSAHHGLARAIHPSHTRHDGDLAFVVATGAVEGHLDRRRGGWPGRAARAIERLAQSCDRISGQRLMECERDVWKLPVSRLHRLRKPW